MNFLHKLKTGRSITRLRAASTMPESELHALQSEIAASGSSAIPPLLELLSHGEARKAAMEVLRGFVDDSSLPLFLEALGSGNPGVVSGVVSLLSNAKGYDAMQLLPFFESPKIPKASLDDILNAQAENLSPERLIAEFDKVARDARPVLFKVLEKRASSAHVPRISQLLKHQDWWIRLFMVQLLGRLEATEACEEIAALLADENKNVRLEAVKALRKARAVKAIPQLVTSLRDPDIKVQSGTIDALVGLGDVSAVPLLLDVLKDESEYSRRAAVEVLNGVATPDAIQDLIRALRDEDWWVRVRAADALGSLGGEKVIDAVVGLLGDTDDFVRRYAVEILNSLPSARAVEPLVDALDDADWWVRERSIDALGKTKDPRAVEPLLDLLHRQIELAPLCVQALARIPDPRCIDALAKVLHSENEELRREAKDALQAQLLLDHPQEEKGRIQKILGRTGEPQRRRPGEDIPLKGRTRVFGAEEGRETAPTPRHAPVSPVPAEGMDAAMVRNAGQINYHDLPVGTVLLDRYRVMRAIGRGGFGKVYLVEDTAIQDELILKVLNPQLSLDEHAIRRFVQELKLTRKISHRNVIRIHDLLRLGPVHAVSMEYFPGEDLGKILTRQQRLDPVPVLKIASQVSMGLIAAHNEGVIHRDIKPGNILVGADGEVKIVDFGLASARHTIGSRLTRSGLLIGTPEYMAPEQISEREVDPRTDIYSLGIVLYELLGGEKPFTGETAVQILFQHLEGTARSLSQLRPEVSPELELLVSRMMARDPEFRPKSGEALHAEIEALLAATEVSS